MSLVFFDLEARIVETRRRTAFTAFVINLFILTLVVLVFFGQCQKMSMLNHSALFLFFLHRVWSALRDRIPLYFGSRSPPSFSLPKLWISDTSCTHSFTSFISKPRVSHLHLWLVYLFIRVIYLLTRFPLRFFLHVVRRLWLLRERERDIYREWERARKREGLEGVCSRGLGEAAWRERCCGISLARECTQRAWKIGMLIKDLARALNAPSLSVRNTLEPPLLLDPPSPTVSSTRLPLLTPAVRNPKRERKKKTKQKKFHTSPFSYGRERERERCRKGKEKTGTEECRLHLECEERACLLLTVLDSSVTLEGGGFFLLLFSLGFFFFLPTRNSIMEKYFRVHCS